MNTYENKSNKKQEIIIFDLTAENGSVLKKTESIDTVNNYIIDVSKAKQEPMSDIFKNDPDLDVKKEEEETFKQYNRTDVVYSLKYKITCKHNNYYYVYIKYNDNCYAKLPKQFTIDGVSNEICLNNSDEYYIAYNAKYNYVELSSSKFTHHCNKITFDTNNNQLLYTSTKEPYRIIGFVSNGPDYNNFTANRHVLGKQVKDAFDEHQFTGGTSKLCGIGTSIPTCIYGKGCGNKTVLDKRYGTKTFADIQQIFSLNDTNHNIQINQTIIIN